MFLTNGQNTEEIRSRINLTHFAFSRLNPVSGRSVEYCCETWPARVADERMLAVFGNDSIRYNLHVRRRDFVPSVEQRRRLYLTSIPTLLVQRRLRWFCHAARRPEGELIKDRLLPKPPCTWRERAED